MKHAPVSVPAGAPGWITAELLAKTLEVWQPYYSFPLKAEDALEMIMNAGQLLNVLKEPRREKVCRPRPCQ